MLREVNAARVLVCRKLVANHKLAFKCKKNSMKKNKKKNIDIDKLFVIAKQLNNVLIHVLI